MDHSEAHVGRAEAPPPEAKGQEGKGRVMARVPISNDGMGVCIRCGNVGVKDTFYGKGKQFCSANCVRGLPPQPPQTPLFKIVTLPHNKPRLAPKPPQSPKEAPPRKKPPLKQAPPPSPRKARAPLPSFDWAALLGAEGVKSAPLSSFPHAPLSDTWDSLVTVGLKLEVKNRDVAPHNKQQEFHWIASVVRIAGYMVQLRYEGFGSDASRDFWLNLATTQVHPVGWCASQGKALIPPRAIEARSPDWKAFLVKRLTGSRTLPDNFAEQIKEALRSRFRLGMRLEVVDKNRISAVRVATVDEVVGGRLHVAYEGADAQDEGFWCHARSALIHPVGWAQVVGHELRATPEYARASLHKSLRKEFEALDATWDLFPLPPAPQELRFREGMKLEAIDPLNLAAICVATVTKVLRNHYLMIGIDGMMAANGADWFCYHASSPCIFPAGFCEVNGLPLTPPRGYRGEFSWARYLQETRAQAAPVALFNKDIPKHGFREGQHVEAVDLMEPRLICVAVITRVVGRLLRVHFQGWDESYDQWCDCESPDLFPPGFCQLVQYPLEPPKDHEAQNVTPGESRRRRQLRGRAHKRKKRFQSPPRDVTAAPLWSAQDSDSNSSLSSASNSAVVVKPSPLVSAARDLAGDPRLWTHEHVAAFLRLNDCHAYCDAFVRMRVDGARFLELSREELMEITHMKVGPSLKIHALIQTLLAAKKR